MIAEGRVEVELVGEADSDFELVLGPAVCEDLPVVHSAGEALAG